MNSRKYRILLVLVRIGFIKVHNVLIFWFMMDTRKEWISVKKVMSMWHWKRKLKEVNFVHQVRVSVKKMKPKQRYLLVKLVEKDRPTVRHTIDLFLFSFKYKRFQIFRD